MIAESANCIGHSNSDSTSELFADTLKSPWDNVYWFARHLINSDSYGGPGGDSKLMLQVASAIRTILDKLKGQDDETVARTAADAVGKLLAKSASAGSKLQAKRQALAKELEQQLLTIQDLQVLALTCEKVMIPINNALAHLPSDDKVFSESVVKAILDTKGKDALADIVQIWDDLGAYGSMTAERVEIVQSFGVLRDFVQDGFSSRDQSIILTAFCQEFERRAAQKRKGRGGRSVENVTTVILNHFGIKASTGPEHFTTGLEIDRWVRSQDGWYIGISCKRTLRERWKQAYTTDTDLLNRHKIKSLWHVVVYDTDLSDDKLTEMGSYRAVFYLPDSSSRFQSAKNHPGMKNYVRPMSRLVDDLFEQVGM